jgi:hypothetical protein
MSLSGAEKAHRLQKALTYGGHATHRLDDVVRLLRAGDAQLWEHGDGCIVTELNQYPLLKAVRYWLIFGELKQCLALEYQINEWALGEGCSVAFASGRPGWGRVAAPTGWRPYLPAFYKPLRGSHEI